MTTNKTSIVCLDRSKGNQIVVVACGLCKTKEADDYHLDPDNTYCKIEEHFYALLEAQLPKEIRELMKINGMVYLHILTLSKESARQRNLTTKAVSLQF